MIYVYVIFIGLIVSFYVYVEFYIFVNLYN